MRAGKKTKKQLRLEEPQTISISSSAIVADVGGETAAGGQLSMSSSSQGSLAALKPMRSADHTTIRVTAGCRLLT